MKKLTRNIQGLKFGKLSVLETTSKRRHGHVIYLCQCDCGNKKECAKGDLVRDVGGVKSCGCIRKKGRTRETQKIYNKIHKAVFRAKEKRFAYELDIDHHAKMILEPCTYCGYKSAEGIGLDRVDSSVGYTKENSVPCCTLCNQAKNDRSLTKFKEWLTRCYKRTIKGEK